MAFYWSVALLVIIQNVSFHSCSPSHVFHVSMSTDGIENVKLDRKTRFGRCTKTMFISN